jgi:Fe-S cluster assembly scaffold protein SufB
MQFINLSQSTDTHIVLGENEKRVFFLFNQSGEITFELSGKNAEAHIFALCISTDTENNLSLIQKHTAPFTTSEVVMRSVLAGNAASHYRGLIHIDKTGNQSSAIQESRALLLSDQARHSSIPSLEILPRDVICHHKASATPFNEDSLFFLQSRGLTKEAAAQILINGFIETSFEKMIDLGVSENDLTKIREAVYDKIITLYA